MQLTSYGELTNHGQKKLKIVNIHTKVAEVVFNTDVRKRYNHKTILQKL